MIGVHPRVVKVRCQSSLNCRGAVLQSRNRMPVNQWLIGFPLSKSIPNASPCRKALTVADVQMRFGSTQTDPSWSFADLTTKHTRYLTHGYHSYPAKFIPQLAARLIGELSNPGDLIVDPFMGSGTTLVEAKLLGRPSVGVDINPVAHLISLAKTTVAPPELLAEAVHQIGPRLDTRRDSQASRRVARGGELAPDHERIDYWFPPGSKRALGRILVLIEDTEDQRARRLLRCAFSNSLKTSSIWLQRSTKPTRDFQKQIPDPFETFLRHARQMAKRNAEFYQLLEERGHLDVPAAPLCEDARNLPIDDGQASLVVTSPPYVTSYEYADLHQLTALWFRYLVDLPTFRKQFIGTAYHEDRETQIDSDVGEEIVAKLQEQHAKKAREVATYFTDMRQVFMALKRKLRRRGHACIVVGNTNLLGVDILNAEVFAEQMMRMGFDFERLIDREIPSKILPQVRDKKTGRFTAKQSADFLAYPHEYILVMRKR